MSRFYGNNASYFLLQPYGDRPTNLLAASNGISSALGQFQAKRANQDAFGVICRSYTGGAVSLYLFLYSFLDPSRAANQIAQSLGAKAEKLVAPPPIFGETNDNKEILPSTIYTSKRGKSQLGNGEGSSFALFGPLATNIDSALASEGEGSFIAASFSPYKPYEIRQAKQHLHSLHIGSGAADLSKHPLSAAGGIYHICLYSSAHSLINTLVANIPGFDFSTQTSIYRPTKYFETALGFLLLEVFLAFLFSGTRTLFLSILAFLTFLLASFSFFKRKETLNQYLTASFFPPPKKSHSYKRLFGLWRASAKPAQIKSPDGIVTTSNKKPYVPHPGRSYNLGLNSPQLASILALGGLTSSHASSSSSLVRPSPVAIRKLESQDGAILGFDVENVPFILPFADRYRGLFADGDPGTGKTTSIIWLWASDLLARFKGLKSASIFLCTKSEDVERVEKLTKKLHRVLKEKDGKGLGNIYRRIDVFSTDPTKPRIEFIDRKNPDRAAIITTEALRYSYGPGAIAEASTKAIVAVFRLAYRVTEDMGYGTNPFRIAYWLMGGSPNQNYRQKIINSLDSVKDSTPGLSEALDEFSVYTEKSKRDTQLDFSAPMSKISQLMGVDGLWDINPNRSSISWRDILTNSKAVILNFEGGVEDGSPDRIGKILSSIAIYSLWEEIKVTCSGWQAKRRFVNLYSDEVSDLVGQGSETAEVVDYLRARGRAYGVRVAFATQWIFQLPPKIAREMWSSGVVLHFAVEDKDTALKIENDISTKGGEDYSFNDILGLASREALVRCRIGENRLPVFNLYVPLEKDFIDSVTKLDLI